MRDAFGEYLGTYTVTSKGGNCASFTACENGVLRYTNSLPLLYFIYNHSIFWGIIAKVAFYPKQTYFDQLIFKYQTL